MNPFAAILAPLLFVPLAAVPGVSPAPVGSGMSNRAALASDGLFAAVERDETGSLLSVISTLSNDVANQVSIEQRLIIRIAPQAPAPQRSGIVANLPHQATSSNRHCPEDTDMESRGFLQYHWIPLLWRYPHGAPQPMLLKVALIQPPDLESIILLQFCKFF